MPPFGSFLAVATRGSKLGLIGLQNSLLHKRLVFAFVQYSKALILNYSGNWLHNIVTTCCDAKGTTCDSFKNSFLGIKIQREM